MREINHGDSSTTLLSDKQYRSIGIAGGVLFGVTQDAPAIMEGDGNKVDIPEMSGDLTQFVFFDVDKNEGWSGTGLDLLYIANRNSGIRKYYYDGIKWVFVSIYNTTIANATGFVAITGNLEGGLPTFYGIKVLESDNSSYLIKVQDKTGPKENWNTTGKYPNVTELASAVGTEMFRGVAFAPGKKTPVSSKDITANAVNLTIKPNVAQNEIRVVLPENGVTTKVNVINIQGSNVLSTQGEGELTIDINDLPKGLYFVKTAEGAQGKFIKQ
jgi:Secretion system C-terminal sorting domain